MIDKQAHEHLSNGAGRAEHGHGPLGFSISRKR
jgi:hypothetical protein